MIYAVEPIDKYLADAPELWLLHDAEVSSDEDKRTPLDMDVEAIRNAPNLIVFTARDGNLLVGYIWFVIMHNPLRKTQLSGYQSLYYVRREYRKNASGVGAKLLLKALDCLQLIGIARVRLHHKLHSDCTSVREMFERIGAVPDELEYTLKLGGSHGLR